MKSSETKTARINELAKEFDIHPTTVYRWLNEGRIRPTRNTKAASKSLPLTHLPKTVNLRNLERKTPSWTIRIIAWHSGLHKNRRFNSVKEVSTVDAAAFLVKKHPELIEAIK